MSIKSQGFVILFGSAAAGPREPRDLDLVIGGDYSIDDAERLAGAWWRKHFGDAQQPPCEVHRQAERYRGGTVHLLRPRGASTGHEVLAGEGAVVWSDVDSLPAALRLAADGHAEPLDGHDKAAREMMIRLRKSYGGRLPLSMATYDEAKPIGGGGYAGDGPIALEQALARTGGVPIDTLLPEIAADGEFVALLTAIRANPGVWSGGRWQGNVWVGSKREKRIEPPLIAGLRKHWIDGTPLGCVGCVGWPAEGGESNVVFNYAPSLPTRLVREIVEAHAPRVTS